MDADFKVLTGVISAIDDGANWQTKRDAEFASRGTSTSYKPEKMTKQTALVSDFTTKTFTSNIQLGRI